MKPAVMMRPGRAPRINNSLMMGSLWALLSLAGAAPPRVARSTDLFVAGAGHPLYRIPALARLNRTALIAFAEGRGAPGRPVEVVMRVSRDAGATWGPMSTAASEPGHVLGNPAPVVLGNGSLLLIYCRDNKQVFSKLLDLSSLSWSPARNVTRFAVDPSWDLTRSQSLGSGPPGGLRLDSGRIVVPFWHIARTAQLGQAAAIRTHVLYSDDAGESWQRSPTLATAGNFSSSESQIASADGGRTLVLTARTQRQPIRAGAVSYRTVATSMDGGSSWGPLRPTAVPDPTCEGSTLGYQARYFMSSAVSAVAGNRSNVSLSVCGADCVRGGFLDWQMVLSIEPGLSSYSSLAPGGQPGTLLCLYELGGGEAIRSLRLALIEL